MSLGISSLCKKQADRDTQTNHIDDAFSRLADAAKPAYANHSLSCS